jgi:hypothetical protein
MRKAVIVGALAAMLAGGAVGEGLAAEFIDNSNGTFNLVWDPSGSTTVVECIACAKLTPPTDGWSNDIASDADLIPFIGGPPVIKFQGDTAPAVGDAALSILAPALAVKQGITTFFFSNTNPGNAISFRVLSGEVSFVAYTPIPAALGLLLTALAGLYGVKRFRRPEEGAVPA